MKKREISKIACWIFILIGISNFIFGYIRLYYGVDFLDEAWYVASIHQFSLGATPFLSEISLQFPFILLAPIYKLFSIFNFLGLGSVLFIRHIYYLIACLTSFTTYRLLIRYVPKSVAFAISSILFVDVFVIPSVSYNTIGRLFLMMGVNLIVIVYTNKEQKFRDEIVKSVLAGLVFAICLFSYPTIIIPIFIVFLSSLIYIKYKKISYRPILIVIGSFLIICAIFFFAFMFNKLSTIMIDLKMLQLNSLYSLDIKDKFSRIIKISELFIIPLVILVVFKLSEKRFKKISSILFIIAITTILIFTFIDFNDHGLQYTKLVTILSFAGFIGYPLFYKSLPEKFSMIFYIIIIPLCVAGGITGLSSANGYANISVGISPCAIFALLIIYLKFNTLSKNTFYFSLIILTCSTMYVFLLFNTIYSEGSFSTLNNRVDKGPYKGLYTTSKKVEFLNDIYDDLNNPIIKDKKTILCYYNFPAGYLFTPLKSDFYSTWIMNWWKTKNTFDEMLKLNSERKVNSGNPPDVVFRYKYNEDAYKGTSDGEGSKLWYDPMIQLFSIDDEHYNVFKQTDEYMILIKK